MIVSNTIFEPLHTVFYTTFIQIVPYIDIEKYTSRNQEPYHYHRNNHTPLEYSPLNTDLLTHSLDTDHTLNHLHE